VRSKKGIYRVTVTPRPERSPVGRLHSWRLTLRTARGVAITNARISVDGDMPEHGHGLPTQPRVREVGGGRYLVAGMKFQMGGGWYVEFRISSGRGKDVARFEFELPDHQ
jgi:YtkA-like